MTNPDQKFDPHGGDRLVSPGQMVAGGQLGEAFPDRVSVNTFTGDELAQCDTTALPQLPSLRNLQHLLEKKGCIWDLEDRGSRGQSSNRGSRGQSSNREKFVAF